MSTASPPSSELRRAWAELILDVLDVEYPHHSGHSASGADDVDVTPDRLFPAFHGCLDWHSSVHMQSSLIRLLPGLADDGARGAGCADRAIGELSARLTRANVAAETDYLRRHPGFERPYGWAWALQLAVAARECPLRPAVDWAVALDPLVEHVIAATLAWLPRLAYPVRHGTHQNTAFALLLMHDALGRLGRPEIADAVAESARRFFLADQDYSLRWEPSGSDFLSPALCEAALMQRVLPVGQFRGWLAGFAPELADESCPLFAMPLVLDRSDGQAVHLLGLALSRAWQLRLLAAERDDAAANRWRAAAGALVTSSLPEVTGGDFMATHWLVSFAVLANSADSETTTFPAK